MSALLKLSGWIDSFNERIGRLLSWLVLAAVLISAGNAILRKTFNIGSNAFLEIQWYLFAAVFMYAVRRLAIETFEHIHNLSLRYHLERKTGGLSRVIDRGRTGIENIVRFATINILPTIVELALYLVMLVLQSRMTKSTSLAAA